MKNYKEFPREYIGASDCACLTITGNNVSATLYFGEDGLYKAYIVPEDTKIGSHYQKIIELAGEIQIVDDCGPTKNFSAEKIIIYRAGEFGCIIQLIQPAERRKS